MYVIPNNGCSMTTQYSPFLTEFQSDPGNVRSIPACSSYLSSAVKTETTSNQFFDFTSNSVPPMNTVK